MPKKLNNNKTGSAVARKERKREEAEARQAKRDGRSTEQQLALISTRYGKSVKERARLGTS